MRLWLLPSQATLERLALPGLATLLRRADALPPVEPGLDAALAAHFGAVPPWATLLAGKPAPAGRRLLLADLVHVLPDIHGARLMAIAADQPRIDPDLDALFAALRPWLAEEGIAVIWQRAGRALLEAPADLGDPAMPAPDAVLGRDLRVALPADLRWQRRINDYQILLAQQPAIRDGRCPWNTLWFWGGGGSMLPAQSWDSDDPLLKALSALATADAPRHLDLRDPGRLVDRWHSGLRPTRAILRSADGAGWAVQPWQRWRIWRR
jgi:hypothetical protein